MLTTVWNRFCRLGVLRELPFLLGFYSGGNLRGVGWFYGQSLRGYPLRVGIKLLMARLVYVLSRILLPDKHFVFRYHGAKLYVELNRSATNVDVAFGVYEYWKTKLCFDLVKEGMTILDIGAWQGNYSIMFARLMHGRGRVLAFEPDPENRRWLRKNIQLNDYKCIEVYECALSDREGTVAFYPGSGSLVRPCMEAITVKTQTLDNVLKKAHVDKVDLIKMDVEGGDLLVLKGAEHCLRTMNVRILMDVDVTSNAERKELFDLFTSCGFSLYNIGRKMNPIRTADELFLENVEKDVQDTSCRGLRVSPSFLETAKQLESKQNVSVPFLSIGRLVKSILPTRIVAVPHALQNMALQWFGTIETVREIYATKLD